VSFRARRQPTLSKAVFIFCLAVSSLSLITCSNGPSSTSNPPPPPAKGFSVAVSPSAIVASAGSSNATFTVATVAQNGFSEPVSLAVSGLPTGTVTSPAFPLSGPVGTTQTISLAVPTSIGSFPFTLTATGGSISHSTPMTLTINPSPDFSLAASPISIVATPGTSNTGFSVSVAAQNGFAGSVAVSVSGLPADIATSPASPFTVPANGSQAVTLSVPANEAAGSYALIATGTSGTLSHATPLNLTISTTPDFSLSLSTSSIATTEGTSNASFTASVSGFNGFSDPVSVALSGLPAGVTTSPAAPFSVAPGGSQTVTLTLPTNTYRGDYTVTATGTSGSLTHAQPFNLTVNSAMTTWHYDAARTSANTVETTLTPANVNSTSFGKIATLPVDGFVVAQPLYLGGVNILGQGVLHNVVYVATMHDSVFAFDADSNSTTPLWTTSILNYSPAGATSVPSSVQKNAGTTGWSEVGIVSTPVIDPATGTLFLVAETYENGGVVHRLHALDVTTGIEMPGAPVTIAASYTLNGKTTTFAGLYQLNRPGLLLANGHIYIAFGSNCCNDPSQGWMLSYNETTLQQEGAYTTEPGTFLASIWQKGGGIAADSSGNIYAETGEGPYVPGTNLASSVLKWIQTGPALALTDWFTPYNYALLSQGDFDLSDGVVVLPDQPGTYPHELIALGKEGTIYLLNRDNMGQLCSACTAGDTQIVQEVPQGAGRASGYPVYWNNTVYFTGKSLPVYAYTLQNGTLVVPPSLQSPTIYGGEGHAILTANGTSSGILWFINGPNLVALDAITLHTLYTSAQAANGRDTLPPLAHFASPIAIDGKVFMGTQNSLVIYGLF